MKTTARIRRLDTPQTTRNGNPLLNKMGEPVYTQYLHVTPEKRLQIIKHMETWLDRIAEALQEMGVEGFAQGAGIDPDMRSQINDEPRAYSWIERFELVYDRIKNNRHKDLTTGIIDMYNNVTGTVYLHSGFPNDMLDLIRIELEDPRHTQVKTYLNPGLFQI